MQEASFTGLLRVLLIIMLVYYVLKFIGRYLLPMFLHKTVSKMEERMREQQEANQPQGKVGETVIDRKPSDHKDTPKDTGEYIDYEEVD